MIQTRDSDSHLRRNASLGGFSCPQANKAELNEMPLEPKPLSNLNSHALPSSSQLNCSISSNRDPLKSPTCEIPQINLSNSGIDTTAVGRSQLYQLLNEQQIQNRKIIERNKKLLGKISSTITSAVTSIPSSPHIAHSRNQSNQSCVENICSIPQMNDQQPTSEPLGDNCNGLNSSIQSFSATPIYINDRFMPRAKPDVTHTPIIVKNNVTLESCLNQSITQSCEYCGSQIKNITALQNHIALLEQENSVLQRELEASKQQETQTKEVLQQFKLEIQELSCTKDALITFNKQLLDQLQTATTEANQTITNLTNINQELNLKAQNYQSTADKLTLQLISLTKATDFNTKRPINPLADRTNRRELDFSRTKPRNYDDSVSHGYSREDTNNSFHEGNSKLQADLNFLNQRIESLRKDNEELLRGKSLGKENLNRSLRTSTGGNYEDRSVTSQRLTEKVHHTEFMQRSSIENSIRPRKRLDLRGNYYI